MSISIEPCAGYPCRLQSVAGARLLDSLRGKQHMDVLDRDFLLAPLAAVAIECIE
jgi:hypothetical protein